MTQILSLALVALLAYTPLSHCQPDSLADGPNSTAPGTERVGWVSPPDTGRSTWGIITSCFTVFLLCSWKCTHLNLPSAAERRGEWHRWHRIPYLPKLPTCRKWVRKVCFMALSVVAPEIIVGMAGAQCCRAYIDLREIEEEAEISEFTMSHAFFARMGGVIVRLPKRGTSPEPTSLTAGHDPEAPDTHSKEPSPGITEGVPGYIDVACSIPVIVMLMEEGPLPFNVSQEDIKEKSQADALTKLLAIVQASWLVIQCIARKVAGLEITQLELMTTGFILCALVTYLFWWNKPFDAERPIVIDCPDALKEYFWRVLDNMEADPDSWFTNNGNIQVLHDDSRVKDLGIYNFMGASFSAIHLAAFNWEFPQPLIQTLWRYFSVAALVSAVYPVFVVIFFSYVGKQLSTFGSWMERAYRVARYILYVLVVINLVSRLALVALTCYCFTSMPASVYTDIDWTIWYPHFS
ncbi:hypothetical protein GQ53DRAFT_804068 [Thozetella sp. PMI_491]|nr:hypothetical protein GQ53DRAFT_804068 [Thozetella sp. PMI_491]